MRQRCRAEHITKYGWTMDTEKYKTFFFVVTPLISYVCTKFMNEKVLRCTDCRFYYVFSCIFPAKMFVRDTHSNLKRMSIKIIQ